MKAKLFLCGIILLLISAPVQAQASSKSRPAIVPLDAEDERFINDITQELMKLNLELEYIDDKLKTILQHLRLLFRPYCKCTDKEFEEYWEGKGLASVINRLREQELSNKDKNLFYEDVINTNYLQNHRRKRQTVFDDTIKLFETRMLQSTERHGISGIANYKLDLINRRFVYLDDSLQVPTLMDSIKEYLEDYSKKLNEEIKETLRKLQQQNEELKAKIAEKKQKKAQRSSRPKSKAKPQ